MTLIDMIETYNIINNIDVDNVESIFEDIDIDDRIDKRVLVSTILDECGAMKCIYETTATFKYFSNMFFKRYKWNITKLLDTLDLKYDPIKNKNIEWTETTSIEQNLDTEEDTTHNRTKANTGTTKNDYDDTETNTISAMNSNDYEPDNKSEKEGSNTRTDNLNEEINASNDRNKSEDLTWEETDTHVESGTNDIIVQDLIEKERKVAQFSIYGWIAKKYAKDLFLLVY